MNTPHFRLLYPDYYEKQAQKLSNVLEEAYGFGGYSLDYHPEKITVILHTQTVQSNGLVAWAPKRAEFYTTPHQSIYPQDWLEQLALHEFRHVVQIGKVNSNLPNIINILLGEQGTALVFGIYLPWWFIEGDAVVTETALSNYGRGRLPSFLMEHRAQVVEKGVFPYEKSYFGSYRDFVPNHYKLGYYLIGNSRARYGSEIWDTILTQIGKKPVTLRPISRILKPKTGLNKIQLYYSIFDSLQRVWTAEDLKYHSTDFHVISPEKKTFTSYLYNYWRNDSSVYSYKTSFNDIPAFVSIGMNGNEKVLYHPGPIFNESVNFRENLIVWAEQIPDPRWAHSGKSLIRILNVETKEVREINPEFKSFSPSISPDKTKVAVVEADFSNNYFVSVYNIGNGKLLHRVQTENNNYFFTPEWLNAGELAAIMLTDHGKRIVRINPETEDVQLLLDKEMGELKHLEVSGNDLYFISSYTARNALYRLHLPDNTLFHIYEPRFGVEAPAVSPNGGKIILSDYTANGFRLIEIPAKENEIPFRNVQKGSYPLAETLAAQEPGIPLFARTDTVKYPSKNYSRAAHLFNVHSWAPFFVDIDSRKVMPGVSVLSQNKLGTSETILGYRWNVAEETGQIYASYQYRGWYPVFNLEINSGNRASEYYQIDQTKNEQGEIVYQDTTTERYTWGESKAHLNVGIPLNLSKGRFNRMLQPDVSYDFTLYKHHPSTPHNFIDGSVQTLKYRLYFNQLMKQSYHDMYPDYGLILDAAYRHSLFGDTDFGSISTLQSIVYLPGLTKNHGVKIYNGFQHKKMSGANGFTNALFYPRGWGSIFNTNTTKMYSFSADYKMPLFYPDWKFGRFVYIRRVVTTFFADFANLKGSLFSNGEKQGTFDQNLSSYGSELTFNVNVMRFYAPSNIGLRASYLPELKKFNFDFLFSINFTSF